MTTKDAKGNRSKVESVAASGVDTEDLELQTAVAGGPEQKVALTGTLYVNPNINIIQVSESQVQIALQNFAQGLSREGIVAPLGIFLSLLALLATADFKTDHLGVPDSTWQALFIGLTALSGLWLLGAFLHRGIRGGRKRATARFLDEIKGGDNGVEITSHP